MTTELRQIVVAQNASVARRHRDAGWCPIECSFGEESVVDDLQMDHHGPLSHLEGVALRAWRDHWGDRAHDPRFLCTGGADADATFAIAALAGELNQNCPRCRTLAALINERDLRPIGLNLTRVSEGGTLLAYHQALMESGGAERFHRGVDYWSQLPDPDSAAVRNALQAESRRLDVATGCYRKQISPQVTVVKSDIWGFDVWYRSSPVVLQYHPAHARATIACQSEQTAVSLFGAGGLLNIYPMLFPSGWGGRPSIGGSPRAERISFAQTLAAAEVAARRVDHADSLRDLSE